ncbi:MAG: phosphopantetheine-binding protein [Candidatus Binatia bacterium]
MYIPAIEYKPDPDMSPLETEVARLMVQTLNLDMDPAHIRPDDALVREGLGLDSIDALELSLAVSRCYGYHLRSDDPDITATFSSLRALCKSIEKHRTK